jgi:beta-lactamase regulating signal transducer with metallopeptidase domain/HEAT repeat protein
VIVDTQWLALFLLKATVLLLAGAAAAAALRGAAAGTRHLAWLATLGAVLLLPVLGQGPLRLPVLPSWPAAPSAAPAAAAAAGTPSIDRGARSSVGDASVGATPADPAPSPRSMPASPAGRPSWRGLGLTLWGAVAAVLLARLLLGSLAARCIVRSARALEDPRWTRLLHELSDRLDLAEAPALLASERTPMPFAFGAFHPAIVLPEGAEDWDEERRRVVLVHELAHVRRRDLLGHHVARLACAAYWFHPLVWSAARRLRAESERACDDLVLGCGARASDYAGHLLDLLTSARGRSAPAPSLPMARGKEFEGRLLALLDPARRRSPGRGEAAALVAGLGVVFLAVAAASPAPAPGPGGASRLAAVSPREATSPSPVASPPPLVAERALARPDAGRRRPAPAAAPARIEAAPETPAAAEAGEAELGTDRDRRGLLMRVLRADPDASVRLAAAWALSEGAAGDEAGVLVAALRKDEDAGVREMAAWALASARGEDATAALGLALEHDASAEVRTTAAWALGQRPSADTKALAAAARDGQPEVREAALWALGNRRLESAPAEVVAGLGDGDPKVRLVAAWALGQVLDPATVPALRTAFAREEDATVRQAIFRALAFLGERSPELLNRALGSKDPQLRARAAQMLGGEGPGIWPWPWPWAQPRPQPHAHARADAPPQAPQPPQPRQPRQR